MKIIGEKRVEWGGGEGLDGRGRKVDKGGWKSRGLQKHKNKSEFFLLLKQLAEVCVCMRDFMIREQMEVKKISDDDNWSHKKRVTTAKVKTHMKREIYAHVKSGQ
jgi:hypothetical protein